MKRFTVALCAFALGLAGVGCSNDPTVENNGDTTTNGSNITFLQVAREGRPGIKELFLPYASHDAFNRQTPSTDTTTGPAITTFLTSAPAGRSAAVAAYVTSLLSGDALVANLGSSATRASYLGYETGGAIASDCTGLAPTTFGGRGLNDDVVNATLGLAFGNLATTSNPTATTGTPTALVSPAPDDGKEQNGANGTPNLTNQDVSCTTKGYTFGAFPYLASPV